MAYLTPLSKALASKAALIALAGAGLTACEGPQRDGQDFQRLAAQIQAIEVDETSRATTANKTPPVIMAKADSANPDDKGLNVIVDTARDLTVGQGGLFTSYNNLKVQVVDPLELDRNQTPPGVLLSEATDAETAIVAASGAMAFAERNLSAATLDAEVKPASQTVNKGRTIQIGSFSTRQGAEAAWDKLTAAHPEMARFNPQMQNIRTNGGKVLVRLKIGPVYTDAEAQVLCDKLSVKDAWCTRAG